MRGASGGSLTKPRAHGRSGAETSGEKRSPLGPVNALVVVGAAPVVVGKPGAGGQDDEVRRGRFAGRRPEHEQMVVLDAASACAAIEVVTM